MTLGQWQFVLASILVARRFDAYREVEIVLCVPDVRMTTILRLRC